MKKGFSLIELLVVIAVIAILSAIAFPVFARAKDSAYRSSDISKMNEIRTALQLYRTDQGAYPPALLGYATAYMPDGSEDPNVNSGNVIPADQVMGALFPKRVTSIQTFQPANVRPLHSQFMREMVEAQWPSSQFLNSDAGQPLQRYGPGTLASRCINGVSVARYYYRVSGFDAATVKDGNVVRDELRYTLFWTGWTVPADPCAPQANERGSGTDNPRQLGYSDPPDTTVVTWNSYFREYDASGVPTRSKRDIVLFLGGSARPMDSVDVASAAWAINP
jgi:prepilin-type N-terminal cleavage/methylation domain-containing protein